MDPASAEFLFSEVEVRDIHAIAHGDDAARTPERIELWAAIYQRARIFGTTLAGSWEPITGSIALPVDTSALPLGQQRLEIKSGCCATRNVPFYSSRRLKEGTSL
jgi:hypothetical protein